MCTRLNSDFYVDSLRSVYLFLNKYCSLIQLIFNLPVHLINISALGHKLKHLGVIYKLFA